MAEWLSESKGGTECCAVCGQEMNNFRAAQKETNDSSRTDSECFGRSASGSESDMSAVIVLDWAIRGPYADLSILTVGDLLVNRIFFGILSLFHPLHIIVSFLCGFYNSDV